MMRAIGAIILVFGLIPWSAYGQKDSTLTGAARGIAFDSGHNYILANATVAIYKADSSMLISYQLTNNYGEFEFAGLPVGIRLKMVLSYVGYDDISIPFTLSAGEKNKDFGKVNLKQKDNELPEVKVVYKPPVRMNKDTLEFNADAFELDENAVVEDLLKKLPGVIVWGDGSITVNGKEVKSLLVNGKPFFGGSTRVAIQNIPKDAVEKVQVYQQGQGDLATRDSTTEVNIKLKDDKDVGYFGKLAVGQGNDNRYEQLAGLNWFSRKTQLGVIGSRNNTNRITGNAVTLLENNTYKGGSDMDYQPQFNLPGLNKIVDGGLIFQRDFIEKTDFYNKNRLDGNYFLSHNNKVIDRNSETFTSISNDENIVTNSTYANKSTFRKHRFDSKYETKKNTGFYSVNVSSLFDHLLENTSSSNITYDQFKIIQSTSQLSNNSVNDNNLILLNSAYERELNNSGTSQSMRLRLNYSGMLNRMDERRVASSEFNSFTIPSQSRVINRNYNNDRRDLENRLVASLDNLARLKLIAGKSLLVGLEAMVLTTNNKIDNKVYDTSIIDGNNKLNPFLTYKAQYQNVSVSPAIILSNTISKTLSNRYEKGFTTLLNIKGQFFNQKVNSTHEFQKSRITYYRFIPEAVLKYTNYRYGESKDDFSVKLRQYSIFPNAAQLLLIADSADIYRVRAGNPNLRPSDVREVSIEVSHTTFRNRNQSSYSANFQFGSTRNYIGDSSIIYKNGQTNYHYVNLPGHRFINAGFKLDKSYKIREQTLQIMASANGSLARVPGILNSSFYLSDVYQHVSDIKIYYYPVSFLGLTIGHNWASYKIHQRGADFDFNSTIHNSNADLSTTVTPRLTLNSHVSFVHNRFTGGKANYNIWNASASYRLLKNKNAEIKFSAFDLLKENSNISYHNTNTSLSTIFNNVLQQYFMLTLSYFPRKFGR